RPRVHADVGVEQNVQFLLGNLAAGLFQMMRQNNKGIRALADDGSPFIVGTRERQNADVKVLTRQMANYTGVQFADGVVEKQAREEPDADASVVLLPRSLATVRRRPGQ